MKRRIFSNNKLKINIEKKLKIELAQNLLKKFNEKKYLDLMSSLHKSTKRDYFWPELMIKNFQNLKLQL